MAVKDIKKLSLETLAQEQQRPTADEAIRLHVKGESRFICDEPKPERLHYATVVVSPYAHARIKQIDAETAKQIDGVVGVFTWRDIPGENELGIKIKDEPLLPENIVSYIGQPVAVIVAATQAIAERSCQAVNVDYEVLEPILTIEQARAK
ncbi:xanthine dehydrogenase molybdopterin binding subunit, partial [bacterium]